MSLLTESFALACPSRTPFCTAIFRYGECVPYTNDLVDKGSCSNFNAPGDMVYVTPQRWTVTSKALLDGAATLVLFVTDECKPEFAKYTCSQIVMPCATHEHNGQTFSFPRPPCRSDCVTFMSKCRQSMIDQEPVIHQVDAMKQYGTPLYDTWCDMTVDGRCSSEPGAEECNYEQFNANSPIRFVDIFQSQPSHPEEGMVLPDGAKIACASNSAVYEAVEAVCPSGFTAYVGEESEDSCVLPCLSFLFDEDQIDTTFAVYVATGVFGFCTNLVLIGAKLTSKRSSKAKGGLPRFVVFCATFGLLFALIDTIPTAMLKLDLPCSDGCADEICHGDSFLCKLGQPSEYLLLCVFFILLSTLLELYLKTALRMSVRKLKTVQKVCVVSPLRVFFFCRSFFFFQFCISPFFLRSVSPIFSSFLHCFVFFASVVRLFIFFNFPFFCSSFFHQRVLLHLSICSSFLIFHFSAFRRRFIKRCTLA